MTKTLYLFPTEFEAAPFRQLNPQASVRIIGVGIATSAALLSRIIAEEQPQRVVLCGIAGACDERLSVGQVVEVVEDSEVGLPAIYSTLYTPRRCTSLVEVVAFTVSRCTASLGLNVVESATRPCVEQMEGAAVGAVCKAWGVEYSHLRAISNRVGDERALWQPDEAARRLAEILLEMSFEE